MNIIKAEINWNKGYANYPDLNVIVDKLPSNDERKYISLVDPINNRESFYCSTDDGFVSFFTSTDNKNGFGGAIFNITMTDGTKRAIKGPWSGCSLYINQTFNPCHEVSYIVHYGQYKNMRLAGAIKSSIFIKLVRECGADVAVISDYGSDREINGTAWLHLFENDICPFTPMTLAIKHKNMSLKESQIFKNK